MLRSFAYPLRRVLYLSPLAGLGGAERVLLDLVASVRVVEPSLQMVGILFADGPLATELRSLGIAVTVLPLPASLNTLGDSGLLGLRSLPRVGRLGLRLALACPSLRKYVSHLRAEIRAFSPDVVHSNGMKSHLISSFAVGRQTPLVWHIHDFLSERPLAGRVLSLLARRASAAIAISDAVAADARRTLPSLALTTILNAVDIAAYVPGPIDGAFLDSLAGLSAAPPGTLRVGIVATYARWKGQDKFLEAAARVRALLPHRSIRFYVVGGPIYTTDGSQFTAGELRRLISDLRLNENAGLVPFQQNPTPIFQALDLFVHASTRPEPFGRSIIEAMACGLPVIVSAAGGACELSKPFVTGLVHPPGDVNELAAAMSALLRTDQFRRRLGKNARALAVRRFSRDRVGPDLVRLYRSLHLHEADLTPSREATKGP